METAAGDSLAASETRRSRTGRQMATSGQHLGAQDKLMEPAVGGLLAGLCGGSDAGCYSGSITGALPVEGVR